MPRIPNYTDDAGVQLNVPLIDGVSSRVSDTPARLGLQMAERRGNDWLRVSELANAIAIRQQALRNSAEVSNAIAAATMELDTVRNAQLERKGLDATGRPATEDNPEVLSAMDTYGQGASSIQEKIRNNLLNDVQKQKFDEWYRNRFTSDMDTVARHQEAQLTAATENATQAMLKSAEDSMYSAMVRGDFSTADNIYNTNYGVAASTLAMQGQTEEYIRQGYNERMFAVTKSAVDDCVKNGNSEAGNEIVGYFGKYLTEKQKNELKGTVRPGIIKDDANGFIKSAAVYNADGSVNVDATLKALEAEADRRGTAIGDLSPNASNLVKFFIAKGESPLVAAAIAGNVLQESGYDPEAENELGAYGLFQHLGDRRDALTEFAKGSNRAASDLNAQLEYAWHEMNQAGTYENQALQEMRKAKTPEEAAVIFRKLFERPGEEEANDGARATEARRVYDGLTGAKESGSKRRDEEFLEAGRAALNRLVQDNKIAIQQRDKDRSNQFRADISAGGIATLSDAVKWCEAQNMTPDDTVGYLHKFKEQKGLIDATDKEQEQLGLERLFTDIAAGKITTQEQFDNYPVSQKAKDAFAKAYFDKAMSWAKLDGVDGLISDATKRMAPDGQRGMAKYLLIQSVNNDIGEKLRNNPTYMPTQEDVRQAIDTYATKMSFKQKEGNYLLWASTYETEYPKAALYVLGDGAEPIDEETARTADGVVMKYDKKTGTWYANSTTYSK